MIVRIYRLRWSIVRENSQLSGQIGKLNLASGAVVQFTFTDAGELQKIRTRAGKKRVNGISFGNSRIYCAMPKFSGRFSLDRSAASQKIRKNSQKSDKVWNPYARSAFRTLKSEVMRLNSDFCLQIANRPFNSGFVL